MFFYRLKDDSKYNSISLQGIILHKDKWVEFIRPVQFNGYEKYIEFFNGKKAPHIEIVKGDTFSESLKEININKNKKIKKESIINEILGISDKMTNKELKKFSKAELIEILDELKEK